MEMSGNLLTLLRNLDPVAMLGPPKMAYRYALIRIIASIKKLGKLVYVIEELCPQTPKFFKFSLNWHENSKLYFKFHHALVLVLPEK